ncbi:MAG TPA: HAD family hydrolase [Candidatus Saccharimonadales bacterium]|jgi:beta-phosphoglucomutase-like phosphatase (HAD superfamily)
MIKGILFDVDGTLVDSNVAHASAWVEAFAEHNITVEHETVLRLIGMGGDKLLSSIDDSLSDESGLGKTIAERRKAIFIDTYMDDLEPTPGSRDLVVAVQRAGLKTVVASSASQQELGGLLKAAQVDDLLTEVTTSDDAENSKPDPDIIHAALATINLPADEVIMIGDTPYDIEAATKAGVACIAVLSGGWKETDLTGAKAVYKDTADILAHSNEIGLDID